VGDREGQGTDFSRWYEHEQRRLLGALVLITGDLDIAEEAVGEACARALARWRRVQAMRSPSGWTYRVAVNVARRRMRRRALETRLLRTHPPPRSIPAAEANPEVWAALRVLPARQRQAMALRYVADLSEREVAAVMGVAPGTVAATLHAARTRLRTLLESGGPDTPERGLHVGR
jgi:RNA polymerase sigma factor (sigma-70 family)